MSAAKKLRVHRTHNQKLNTGKPNEKNTLASKKNDAHLFYLNRIFADNGVDVFRLRRQRF